MQRILIPTRGRLADAMFQPMEWGNGVGRRFRPTINHMDGGLPENDSRPLHAGVHDLLCRCA